jgi:phage gp16-like protein
MIANRNAMMRKLHAEARAQNLDEETYRDKLERITGKRSAKNCTDAELARAAEMFPVKHSSAHHPHHAKIKALWIAAWNLGGIESGSDDALDAFIVRQCGKERLTFVTPAEAASITEALKAILSRSGFVVPKNDAGGMEARRCLIRAQWKRLAERGKVRIADDNALHNFVSRKYLECHGSLINLKRHQLDDCAKAFGRWLRG